MTKQTEPLLGVLAVARRLSVDAQTVRRFITEGDLPAFRVGRSYRVDAAALDEFLAKCRLEP